MKRMLCFAFSAIFLVCSNSYAGLFDDFSREVLPVLEQRDQLDNGTIISGLKEALATSTERAVTEVAKADGYFGNRLIKILLPDKVQQAADLLSKVGYRQQVDNFVLSMNRAAEKAAPKASRFFGDAIREMTVEDARGILGGGDTAATRYFEKKTRAKLFNAFKPSIAKSMEQVGTARAYREMIGKYETLPLASITGTPSLDLDTTITEKALDGLFVMVGEQEKRIRTNPAARTTDLLKKVFGGR